MFKNATIPTHYGGVYETEPLVYRMVVEQLRHDPENDLWIPCQSCPQDRKQNSHAVQFLSWR